MSVADLKNKLYTQGKFFFQGSNKVFLKGVTYGPFKDGSHGNPFPEPERVESDFQQMQKLGVNCIRTYTIPPPWLLEAAERQGIWTMVGIPWTQHVTFLDSKPIQREIRQAIAAGVEACSGYGSVCAYLIGNEVSPDIIRWHGAKKVEVFLKELTAIVKGRDPEVLVSYASFPSTEFLELDFIDFYSFNVYLHRQEDFRKYLARLQNLSGSKPLVLSEFGADSLREGEASQAEILDQKLSTSFLMGAAGTIVFSWTDEWFTGGHAISDWAFGLVTTERKPKLSFDVVNRHYSSSLPPLPDECPRVSVVVCAYNAVRTIDSCLAALEEVRYPDYEVIVVNDGSNDGTLEICKKYSYIKLINQENKGLSVARNVGMEAATGVIIAYTDSDCNVDPDWITYLVHSFAITGQVAVGGPNFPPPEDSLVPACVAVSPGGPTHVLIDDMEAEHIAGCNMAFKADVLRNLGGFDAQYRAAGDDVDMCWRLQDMGYSIGFSPAAQVWHFRRNTVKDYFNQQRGYGKAEAMVFFKHPDRFNLLGQMRWLGRIYGDMSMSLLPTNPFIYSGVFGMAPFQSLYQAPASLWAYLPQTLEWNLVGIVLIVVLLILHQSPFLGFIPLGITVISSLVTAWKAPLDPRFLGFRSRLLIAYMILGGQFARTIERYKWRRRLYRQSGSLQIPSSFIFVKSMPKNKDILANYWTNQGVERDAFLKEIIHLLNERKLFVNIESGWSRWDFKVQQGLWGYANVQSCAESHGGNDRLLRLRARLHISLLGRIFLSIWIFLIFLLLIERRYVVLLVFTILGGVLALFALAQILRLGTTLSRVFTLSADRLHLVEGP